METCFENWINCDVRVPSSGQRQSGKISSALFILYSEAVREKVSNLLQMQYNIFVQEHLSSNKQQWLKNK